MSDSVTMSDTTEFGESTRPEKHSLSDMDAEEPVRPFKRADLEGLPSFSYAVVHGDVSKWVFDGPPVRPNSAPPEDRNIELYVNHGPPIVGTSPDIANPRGLQPTVEELLDRMDQRARGRPSVLGSPASSSAASGFRNIFPLTARPNYRSVLFNNGVTIDNTGSMIPMELDHFLDTRIRVSNFPRLSGAALADAVRTAESIADRPERSVYDLLDTATLPVKMRGDVARGTATPWYTDCLPRRRAYDRAIAQPRPDVHCGYPVGPRSGWPLYHNAVVDHAHAERIAQPGLGNCLPFFVLELESESAGGSIWHGENKAAGAGSSCVNAMRWLVREAYWPRPPPGAATAEPNVLDTIAFSACVTHREVAFHVHHYSRHDGCFYMSGFGTFQTMRDADVQACHDVVRNIIDWGMGTRQRRVRQALNWLHPVPSYWNSQQASMRFPSDRA